MMAATSMSVFRPLCEIKPHSTELLEAVGIYLGHASTETRNDSNESLQTADSNVDDAVFTYKPKRNNKKDRKAQKVCYTGTTTQNSPPGLSQEYKQLLETARKFTGYERALLLTYCSVIPKEDDLLKLPQARVLYGSRATDLLVRVPRLVDAYCKDTRDLLPTDDGDLPSVHTPESQSRDDKYECYSATFGNIFKHKHSRMNCKGLEIELSKRCSRVSHNTLRITILVDTAAQIMRTKKDPIRAAACLIGAYNGVCNLEDGELRLLFPLMCLRLCMDAVAEDSELLGSKKVQNNKLPNISTTWDTLRVLSQIPPALAYYTFRSACGLTPSLHNEVVVNWLQGNSEKLSTVLDTDNAFGVRMWRNVHIFDLSIGSALVASNSDTRTLTAAMHEEILDANEKRSEDVKSNDKSKRVACDGDIEWVGVGRYNEARLLETSDVVSYPYGEMPERQTVTLGIQLFPARALDIATINSKVGICAPLPGEVYSVGQTSECGYTIVLKHEVDEKTVFYTMYGNLSRDTSGCVKATFGAKIGKGEKFAYINTGRCGADGARGARYLPPHLHFQLITDITCIDLSAPDRSPTHGAKHSVADNSSAKLQSFRSQTRCTPSQREVWLSVCPDPNLILGIPAQHFPAPVENKQTLLASRRAHVGRNLSVSYGDADALHIARASQQFLYDVDGRAYLDFVNNVCHVGHANPRVVRAATKQMAVLNTNTRYVYDNLTKYAEKLTATLPESLSVCFFVNSGSEANDLALRMAREHTGRSGVIALGAGYHGNLSSLIDISAYKNEGPGGNGPGERTHVALMPDPYRGKYRGMSRDTGEKYANHVKELLEGYAGGDELDTEGHNTNPQSDNRTLNKTRQLQPGVGAFIAESVLGCGGQVVLCDGYLESAYKHVRAKGGVCIADEVQVGFGRVGCKFWGFETQGVVPDIVTMGKPIGNGHPLGAVVTTRQIAESFDNQMEYFNTFGGNPVSCAVGLAVLDEIQNNNLQARAQTLGDRFLRGLRGLKARHPLIGDVRGLGLFVGVELVLNRDSYDPTPADKHASYVAKRVRDFGVLISTDGPDHNVLKMKPPMVVVEKDIDRLVDILDRVLGEDLLQLGNLRQPASDI